MASLPHTRTDRTQCCSVEDAWRLVREIAWLALQGDNDAHRWLPAAVDHALKMGQVSLR